MKNNIKYTTYVFGFFLIFGTVEASSERIGINELIDNYNPVITEQPIKVETDKNGTYANIGNKKQYLELDDKVKKEAQDFSNMVIKGIKSGVINDLSDEDRKKALNAWVVYSYTNYEIQEPIYYCDKYYTVNNYKDLFKKTFNKAHLEAKKRLINLWGESGYEYVSTEYKKIKTYDTSTMDENYKDFIDEMATRGVSNVDKVMFCKFIDYAPEMIVEQQKDLFKIQHPDYKELLVE